MRSVIARNPQVLPLFRTRQHLMTLSILDAGQKSSGIATRFVIDWLNAKEVTTDNDRSDAE